MSSLISAVADHWMLIEERRMRIRSGEMKVGYRGLVTNLEGLLTNKYQNNLKAMANDFLFENQSNMVTASKNDVIEAIIREFAIEDQVFNLYEEEYITAKYLRLVILLPTLQMQWFIIHTAILL